MYYNRLRSTPPRAGIKNDSFFEPHIFTEYIGFLSDFGPQNFFLTKKVARFFFTRTITRLVRNKTRCEAGENRTGNCSKK